MMPIGPLMIEHRLIEKMIALIDEEAVRVERTGRADPDFIETAVDFIRTYADRCHHGKEEDILFRELEKKDLSPEHAKIMNELIEEHKWGRTTTARLWDAVRRYAGGDSSSRDSVQKYLKELAEFYPKHIEKEDKRFFIPVMDYFSPAEKDAMLEEGYRFDRDLIHLKYQELYEAARKKKAGQGRLFD